MADIELVIKISEDSYKATCNGCMLPPDVKNVVQGIKNGIPLEQEPILDKVKQAREEMKSRLYKGIPETTGFTWQNLGINMCLEILDKLIESEG